MTFKKTHTHHLDTRARRLMEQIQSFKSIHVRSCPGKRQFENIFSEVSH